jgi:cytochrome c peroxidase
VLGALIVLGLPSRKDDPWRGYREAYARPTAVPFPVDNAYTKAREALGRALFFDPRLSRSQVLSCASCHNPGFAWTDGLPRAVGHGMKELARRTPTIVDGAFANALFWDGRAATLEEQALGPIVAAGEMNMDLESMVARVEAIGGYRPLFADAYPGEPISPATVAKAIATFERTVVSGEAPFDRFVAGRTDAIPEDARRGFVLFNTSANCASCHSGWRLTDDSFHDIGVASDDIGRGKLVDLAPMQHAFKTPTLRNVAIRAPYMHDGSEATLDDVIELYDRGGRQRRPSLSREIRPLGLSERDKHDLIAFLQTLTSVDAPVTVPVLPR